MKKPLLNLALLTFLGLTTTGLAAPNGMSPTTSNSGPTVGYTYTGNFATIPNVSGNSFNFTLHGMSGAQPGFNQIRLGGNSSMIVNVDYIQGTPGGVSLDLNAYIQGSSAPIVLCTLYFSSDGNGNYDVTAPISPSNTCNIEKYEGSFNITAKLPSPTAQ